MKGGSSLFLSRSITTAVFLFLCCIIVAKIVPTRHFGVKVCFIFLSLFSFIFMVNNIKAYFVQNQNKSIYASTKTSVIENVAENAFSQLCEELGISGGKRSFNRMVEDLFTVSAY